MNEDGMALLRTTLSAAVPLRIADLQRKGGPDAADYDRARAFGPTLGAKGDILQFGGGKPGEVAKLFNELSFAIAVGAFAPGGIRIFGDHYEAVSLP